MLPNAGTILGYVRTYVVAMLQSIIVFTYKARWYYVATIYCVLIYLLKFLW